MARCDQGYLCEVCGDEVEEIIDSDLYLSYVVGLVRADVLLSRPERHVRCNPSQAQFIVDPEFPPVTVDGPFGKAALDPAFVGEQEQLFTRGWRRLREVSGAGLHFLEYPLPEFRVVADEAEEARGNE
jgi:hypothetical protein